MLRVTTKYSQLAVALVSDRKIALVVEIKLSETLIMQCGLLPPQAKTFQDSRQPKKLKANLLVSVPLVLDFLYLKLKQEKRKKKPIFFYGPLQLDYFTNCINFFLV